jgi:hypothetical protein
MEITQSWSKVFPGIKVVTSARRRLGLAPLIHDRIPPPVQLDAWNLDREEDDERGDGDSRV